MAINFCLHGSARTIREAVARSGESGTRSILDIDRVSAVPGSCRAAPLTVRKLG